MIEIELLKKRMYDVIGAIYEVHKELGAGLNEYCYQEGLQLQLEEQDIPFQEKRNSIQLITARKCRPYIALTFYVKVM